MTITQSRPTTRSTSSRRSSAAVAEATGAVPDTISVPAAHAAAPVDAVVAPPQLPDLSGYTPTTPTNPLGWDLKPVRITRFGPDQSGVLRQYAANPRSNENPPLVGLAGLLLGVDIVPAGADQPHGGRLYLAIDLQGQLPEQINQLRLRIGTGDQDRNWPVRTALYGLIAGGFHAGGEVGLATRPGKSIFFLDVLQDSGRAVIPPRGYWNSEEAIGYTPLDILLHTNILRRRLGQPDLGPEVFGDLIAPVVEISGF